MKLPFFCTLTLGLVLGLHSRSAAEVLAVTHADFSTAAQGTNGFSYGYYDGPDSTTAAFATSLMTPQSDSYGPFWVVDPSGSQTPSLNRNSQHPGISLLPVVRRYVVGASGESSFTGTVRIVGRFFDLNYGATNVFIAVDPDGDGPMARTLLLPSTPMANSPISFDLSTTVAPGTTIDFGTLAMGSYNSDSTGLAAWIVTNDSAVPTNVVAPLYHSTDFPFTTPDQDFRGLAFVQATDAIVTAANVDCFDTSPGGANHPYQFAGLLYLENSGSGMATRFDQVRLDMGTAFADGGDFAETPRLFLLRHNSDPASNNPVADERYALLPVVPVKSTNAAGRPVYTFNTSALSASQRTGYGFAVVGPGSGSNRFISVSEIAATATRVADSGVIAPQPAWAEYNGHRYARGFTRGTWQQCEAEAVTYGGHLVSLNSAPENDWVFNAFGRGPITFIGLRQNPLQSNVEPNGGWTWMDGTVLSDINGNNIPGVYKNWNDSSVGGSEPNHSGGAGEDYAVFASSVFSGRSTWGDVKNAGFPETSDFQGIIELPTPGSGGPNLRVIVPGTANISGAGAELRTPADSTTPTVNGGGTGGSAPLFVNLPTGAGTIRFSSITGFVGVGGASDLQNIPPDGGTPYSTLIAQASGYNGHAGIVNGYGGGFLTGVFVDADGAVTTLPPALDFSSSGKRQNFVSLAPKLNQPFFIGDGLTGSGTGDEQRFHVPAGATRLYLGIADAYNGTPFQSATGVGAYQDNGGAFDARFTVAVTPAITNAEIPLNGGQLEFAGGTGPYAVTLVGGSLPSGLVLTSPSGLLTGAAANGAYSFTLRVTDSLSVTSDQTFSGSVSNPVPPSNGLVTWWPGDNTVADIIGGNHGSLVNSATFGPGKVGRAFQFNGTDQSIQSASATDVMKHLPLTIEGWIKPEARTTGTLVSYLPTNVIANDRQNFGGHGFGAHLYPDGSMFKVGIEGATEDFRTVPGVTFADGEWVHVAVVYSVGNVKTYLNGVLMDDYSFTQGALNGGDIIRVGRHNDDTGFGSLRFFKGAIDELSLYHRALSVTDVGSIYNAGSGGKARHDAARDYSSTTKDGPVWSYRWLPPSVSLTSYDPAHATSRLLPINRGFDGNGIHGWGDYGFVSLNPNPTDVVVNSGGTQYTWYPQQLGMGPNSGEQRPVVRWKAPQSGVYAVSGTFYGADTLPTTVDVHIYHNSTQLSPSDKRYVNTYRGNGVSHTQVVEAAANDTVDFVLGAGGNGWTYDSSGLTAFVTRVGDIIPTSGNGIASWGQGANGALGNGSTVTELSPVPVSMDGALDGKTISAVAGGLGHSLALDTAGKVYAWGYNESGQLGEGSTIQRTTARAVLTTGALSGKTVTRIAACEGTSFAVTSDGKLITWGRKHTRSFASTPVIQATPTLVSDSLLSKTVTSVACGIYHVLALTSDGEIHSWGVNHAGQLGTGTTTGRDVPTRMTTTGTALASKTVTAVAIVGGASFALTSDGKVFAWGLNDVGQLGDGSTANRSLPVQVGGLLSTKFITKIASGSGRHQLALASDGMLFSWGDNTNGQLGDSSTVATSTPLLVPIATVVADVYVGADYSLARSTDGQLFAWGADAEGQVGDGVSAEAQQLEPVAVDRTTSLGGQFVVAASAGSTHALAVTAGTAVQEIVVRDSNNADVVDGGTVSLGNQAVGTPAAPRTFTLRNAGAAPLTITSVTLSGGNATDFGLNASGAIGSIAPGSSRTFSVTFTAAALGARSTTVSILSNDSDEATFDFTLSGSGATDATPPSLNVIHAWVEKPSTQHAFKLLLDARDNVGIQKIQVRSKINSTTALPDATPWIDQAWQRDTPVVISAVCTSIVIELRALDAAGNASPLQRRTFKTPFPISTAPNLTPKFVSEGIGGGRTIDCRGLFCADFDGDGDTDILVVDRGNGFISVIASPVTHDFSIARNAVSDSAIGDFDADGRPDVALVLNNALVVYHNDGLDGSNVLQFSLMNVQGLATTGISTVVGVTAGDVTGEGKDDILISGTGDDGAMGTVAKIAVLINNGQFQLGASNNARAFPTSSAGPIRLGDVTGDGWADAVMIDAANNQVLLFINKRNGSFGGADDSNTTARPQATVTGGLPAQALAVGDITGDGRADVVVTLHTFAALDGAGTERDHLLWQLLDSRGAAPLHASEVLRLGQGDLASSSTAFRSDVILQDLNGDQLPEAIFTNPFEPGAPKGGVRALRVTCQLNETNTLSSFAVTPFSYATAESHPHRLAVGQFWDHQPTVVLATDGNKALRWIFLTYTPLSKTYDLATGAATDSDPTGTLDTNGLYVYDVKIGGLISYSISYVNNGTTAITGGVVDCLLPANLSIEGGDAGYATVPSGTSKFIRWTQDIPAGSSGVRRFTARVLSGVSNAAITPNAALRKGTTVLVTKAMPKVVLEEPLDLRMTVLTDSDSYGQRAHVDETITYRMKVKNLGTGPISGFKLGMSIPANTTLLGGTSPPTPVLTGTSPNFTSVTWTNLSLNAGASITLDVRVKVKPTVATGISILNNTATVTRADGQKIIAPAASTKIDPPIEITLSSNKNIVQPGDTIRYTFTAKNWLTTPFTNAKVVDKLPTGVALLTAAANDAVDSPSGNGNFVYGAGTWTAAQLSTTTLPAYDRSTGIMTWVLGTVPAGVQRNIEFDVIVAQDIPTFANISGVSTTLEVQNKSFNFVGTSSTGARIFAGAAVGGTAANALTATSDKLLSNNLIVRRSLLSDPPLAAPKLGLLKSALGDGQTYIAGESFTTVINDSTVTTDGLCDYRLTYANLGVGTARGVVIHDFVPTNMTFVGNIWKNGAPIPSLVGCRFYDAAGKEMPVIGREGFTDTNGNGFYDVGEVYTDTNANKKYDGPTASLVRSMDFPAGDLNLGGAGNFVYRTKTVSSPGIIIVSSAGGLTGVKNGLEFTKVAGYHLTADNLHFPVNGSPKQVKVLITGPAAFHFPYDAVKSRSEMVGTQITEIVIPFATLGGSSLTMSGNKMTVTIPKGYLVPTASVEDRVTPTPNTRAATIARNASTGITTVTFPLDAWKDGYAIFQVQLDPVNKSVLKGTSGQIKAPLRIEPTLSGGYRKPGSPTTIVPITTITRLLASLPVRDTISPPPVPAPPPGMAPPPTSLADAKIFVGRCAPVSVKRGDTFGYTIFVGNLTNLGLGTGTIEMNVPTGCDFVSASLYKWNGIGAFDESGAIFPTPPVRSGSKVTWSVGSFFPLEGGAVTLTVKVREDFAGTRIDDNTCIFDVLNASGKTPGPLGIVVRAGNEITQSADIVQSAASGLGMAATNEVRDALVQNITLGDGSCTITTGGTDLLQLNNGVIVIQLGGGRVLTAGPPDKILASGIRLVKDDAMMRVAVGPGDSSGVQLTKLPTLAAGLIQPTNTLLANLHLAASSMVAAGGGNMVAAGGGNMVAAGGGNLVGNDGASLTGPNGARLIGNDGSTFTGIAGLVAAGGGNLIGNDGSTMVAAGGGNMVAAGGGNMVAAGGGNLIGNDGSTLVAAGSLNLIGQDGSTMVAAGGGNMVAAGGGNLVAAGGLNLIPNK